MAEKPEKTEKDEKKKESKQSSGAEQKKEEKKGPPKKEEKLTSIVRLAGKDVNGSLPIERALDQVKGIGPSMAHYLTFAIETKAGIPRTSTFGALNEEQIEKIEDVIKNPQNYGIPLFTLNRQKDMETGKDIHLVGNELLFATRQDVSREIGLKTWRGHRHQYGQRVRGQHTRSTGRSGATVGVVKKAEAAKMAPAKAGEAAAAPAAKKEEKKEKPAAAAPA